MRITCLLWLVALFSFPNGAARAADDDYSAFSKKWLDESTWPKLLAAPQIKVDEKDDAITKLLKERYLAAQREFGERYMAWMQKIGSLPTVFDAADRAIRARLEWERGRADRLAILKDKVAFAKVVEKQAATLYKEFRLASMAGDEPCSTYFRANAELELFRAEKAAEERKK